MTIDTYQFGDPDPVPFSDENNKIYPYFKFDGYSHNSEPKEWNVVILENDYIMVYVLPDVGGKIWGAIEKSTREEFIYRNEVMKFRNIAMRGPWTSGGIEFNFGIIGHSPTTATPVDYLTKENEDGSVSCYVGTMDLHSRTEWRVEIRLPHDKAYFETNVTWYNPTASVQSYYNWMTGAAAARSDLEITFPGNAYLTHSGEVKPWPIDEAGRNLSYYKNNAFGSNKSYHVVGSDQNYSGGYYHDKQFGFGHWSRREEMPGQKLWLWAQSRTGAIWEDLLTDKDGQYIEFQAGRLFNQYTPDDHKNPIAQEGFAPNSLDRWTEIWFPLKEIGGMKDASPKGVLNVQETDGGIEIGLNALSPIQDTLYLAVNDVVKHKKNVKLSPMEVLSWNVPSTSKTNRIDVILGDYLLHYSSDPNEYEINRPFLVDSTVHLSSNEQKLYEAQEAIEYRDYQKAFKLFKEVEISGSYLMRAWIGLSQCYQHQGNVDQMLYFAKKVLQVDTYHARANFLVGIGYSLKKDWRNAKEALGWSARSMEFRSASYAKMAEINLVQNKLNEAREYADKSVDFNKYNLKGLMVKAIALRRQNLQSEAIQVLSNILSIDPLHHMARYELLSLKASQRIPERFIEKIKNEFADETCLEVALYYLKLNEKERALEVLEIKGSVKNQLWTSYLLRDLDEEKSKHLLNSVLHSSIQFVLPYRQESLEMLQWAIAQNRSWKFKYYLGLNLLARNRTKEADELFKSCKNEPDEWPFYILRANKFQKNSPSDQLSDIRKASKYGKDEHRVDHTLISYYLSEELYADALKYAKQAFDKYPENYSIGLLYAEALTREKKYLTSIEVLSKIKILPYEHSYKSRVIYENTHLLLAMEYLEQNQITKAESVIKSSLLWPENLGVGEPYTYDKRKQWMLTALCAKKQGYMDTYMTLLRKVADIIETGDLSGKHDLLSLIALKQLGEQEKLHNYLSNLSDDDWMKLEFRSANRTDPEETLHTSIIKQIGKLH